MTSSRTRALAAGRRRGSGRRALGVQRRREPPDRADAAAGDRGEQRCLPGHARQPVRFHRARRAAGARRRRLCRRPRHRARPQDRAGHGAEARRPAAGPVDAERARRRRGGGRLLRHDGRHRLRRHRRRGARRHPGDQRLDPRRGLRAARCDRTGRSFRVPRTRRDDLGDRTTVAAAALGVPEQGAAAIAGVQQRSPTRAPPTRSSRAGASRTRWSDPTRSRTSRSRAATSASSPTWASRCPRRRRSSTGPPARSTPRASASYADVLLVAYPFATRPVGRAALETDKTFVDPRGRRRSLRGRRRRRRPTARESDAAEPTWVLERLLPVLEGAVGAA